MERDKYYTPTIEEFHVGFEYDRFYPEGFWESESMIVNSLTLEEIDEEIDKKEIRVKYLDEEDIESLEFEFYTKDYYGTTYKNMILDKYLTIHNTGEISIHNGESYEDNETYFSGYLKNKSELKRIIKQIDKR